MRAVGVEVPLEILAAKLTKPNLRDVALKHGLSDVTKHHSKDSIAKQLLSHRCSVCPKYVCVFVCTGPIKSGRERTQTCRKRQLNQIVDPKPANFPPTPLTRDLEQQIISGFANDIQVENYLESACAVCGLLTKNAELQPMDQCELDMNLLVPDGPVTRKERVSSDDAIEDITGPVVLQGCNKVCLSCLKDLRCGKMPSDSLANGLWIGEVPPQLQGLSWTEKLLISRVKHNICIVKVHVSGMSKMKANVVSHSLPMPKVH
ncbi:hypothetical protein C8Q76DRAFT_611778, partial [Earliella scabrosa]